MRLVVLMRGALVIAISLFMGATSANGDALRAGDTAVNKPCLKSQN